MGGDVVNNLLRHERIRTGVVVGALMLLVGLVVGWFVAPSGRSGYPGAGDVLLTSGSQVHQDTKGGDRAVAIFDKAGPLDVPLPTTADEAVSAGWKDPFLCSTGRGRYFQNEVKEVPYFLMFNFEDNLIGLYHFSDNEMPYPWRRTEELKGGGGIPLIEEEHWGLFVYFQNPTRACRTPEQALADNPAAGRGFLGERKYEPPATPMPATGQSLEDAASRMASLEALDFTLTSGNRAKRVEGSIAPPDRVDLQPTGPGAEAMSRPFRFEGLGASVAGIARVVQDPSEAADAWIDNVQSRGVSGSILGENLAGLIPDAIAEAKVTVTLWMDAGGMVRRLRIEGQVLTDDPARMVREPDLREPE